MAKQADGSLVAYYCGMPDKGSAGGAGAYSFTRAYVPNPALPAPSPENHFPMQTRTSTITAANRTPTPDPAVLMNDIDGTEPWTRAMGSNLSLSKWLTAVSYCVLGASLFGARALWCAPRARNVPTVAPGLLR